MTVAISLLASPVTAQQDITCAGTPDGWHNLTQHDNATPRFMTGAKLDVTQLLICDGGVYIFFRAREWDAVHTFCLVYAPGPNHSDMPQIHDEMQSLMRNRYHEGETIYLKKERKKMELILTGGDTVLLEWRGRRAQLPAGDPWVWANQSGGLHPVVLFIMLFPR